MMAAVVSIPVALGFWQLDRAAQKEVLRDRALARAGDEAVALPEDPADGQALEYRTVVVEGSYEPAYQVFLDNRVHRGRPGFEVVTPLKPAGSRTRVLVNRGWVPWPGGVREVPEVVTPAGRVRIRGSARIPSRGLSLGALEPLDPDAATVWQYLDLDEYAAQAPFPVHPLTILLDPAADAGGFVRQWPGYDDGWIQRHRAYALQWFGLAVAAAAVMSAFWLRGRGNRS